MLALIKIEGKALRLINVINYGVAVAQRDWQVDKTGHLFAVGEVKNISHTTIGVATPRLNLEPEPFSLHVPLQSLNFSHTANNKPVAIRCRSRRAAQLLSLSLRKGLIHLGQLIEVSVHLRLTKRHRSSMTC